MTGLRRPRAAKHVVDPKIWPQKKLLCPKMAGSSARKLGGAIFDECFEDLAYFQFLEKNVVEECVIRGREK